MHITRTTRTAAAALLALGLAGCAGPGTGSPEPTTGGETTSSDAASDPFHIENPKNLAAVSDPCELLTPQQVQQLGAGPPKPDGKSAWGQAQCLWRNQQLTVSVAPDTIQGVGLSYTAKIVADGKPTAEVAGYPALHYGVNDISCGTYVGTSKTDLFLVSFTVGSDGRGNPEYADPCAMSDKIAGMVLENLPPA